MKLVVAGDGPYLDSLKEQAEKLNLQKQVIFTGMIAPSETALYYKAADFFISASTSETQGLTYLESLASGTPVIAHGNPYLDNLISDKMFGTLYYGERELAGAILEALIATPDMSEQKLADKLYEISAENFGKRVHEFYLDAIISNNFEHELHDGKPVSQRFLKTILYLSVFYGILGSNYPESEIIGKMNSNNRIRGKYYEKINAKWKKPNNWWSLCRSCPLF